MTRRKHKGRDAIAGAHIGIGALLEQTGNPVQVTTGQRLLSINHFSAMYVSLSEYGDTPGSLR